VITRRRVLLAVLAFFLVGVGCVAWTLAGLPPVKYYLRYGLDPYCEPTGERVTLEGVEFVEIGPGVFRMGSTVGARGGDWLGRLCAPVGLPWGRHPEASDEMPGHFVEFRRGYWIATTEITNVQYERYRGDHRRSPFSNGDDTPVAEASWQDAVDFCGWLAAKAGRPIRLPTEAEWECACRAGSDAEFTFGEDEASISEFAWYHENSEDRAHTVATKRPNRWGLFDLHGNVWEWCEDMRQRSYEGAPADGSAWTEIGEIIEGVPARVFRSGGFCHPASYARSARRTGYFPSLRMKYLGFRPAFSN